MKIGLLRRISAVALSVILILTAVITSVGSLTASGAGTAAIASPLRPIRAMAIGNVDCSVTDSNGAFYASDTAVFSSDTAIIGSEISDNSLIIDGFKAELNGVSSILLYVKLSSANTLSVSASVYADYHKLAYVPNMTLGNGAVYYTLAKGRSVWQEKEAALADNIGALKFDGAFEGYVKIPLESFVSDSTFAHLYEIDSITGLEFGYEKLGGSYGSISISPFMLSEDNGETQFALPENYTEPAADTYEDVKAVPITDYVKRDTNTATVTSTLVTPLSYTTAKGISMAPAADPYTREDGNINASQAYAGFDLRDMSVEGYEGIIVYVKLDAANTIMPEFNLTMPEGRWTYSYNPVISMKVGSVYEYMPVDGTEWTAARTVVGSPGFSKYFGAIRFDSAFEGYIKIPFNTLYDSSESGYFVFSEEFDTIKYAHFKLLGLGGNYGNAVIGPLFLIERDGFGELSLPEADPIIVSPITGWTMDSYYATSEVAAPLDFTTDKGIKSTAPRNGAAGEYPYGLYVGYDTSGTRVVGKLGTSLKFSTPLDISERAKDDYILIYVKTDAANTIMPAIGADRNGRGLYEWTLRIGETYEYLELGSTQWKSGVTGDEGYSKGNEGQTYATRKCYGTITFDKAFEGYIKVRLSQLATHALITNSFDPATDDIVSFWYKAKGLSGSYGSITYGPIFFVDSNSESATIKLADAEAVEVIPLTGGTAQVNNNYVTAATGAALDFTDEKGISISANNNTTIVGVDGDINSSKASGAISWSTPLDLSQYSSVTEVIFYVKTDAGNTLLPGVNTLRDGSTKVWTVRLGSTYDYLPAGGSEWKTGTVEDKGNTAINNNAVYASRKCFGTITFDEAFEGYIKLPISAFCHPSIAGNAVDFTKDTLQSVWLNAKYLGGEYGSVAYGPMFLVNGDSQGTRFVVESEAGNGSGQDTPTVVLPEDPMERARAILKNSRDGIAQAYYFSVGDSTRAMVGNPVFRLLREVLKNEYNAVCVLQAKSGQKTEHWSLHTKGLQGSNPTVEDLIKIIPGDGTNCIVDISLGINDSTPSANTAEDVATFLKEGIDLIKAAKPNVTFIYTSPNLISTKTHNTKMREAAKILLEDKDIGFIDVTNNVLEDYWNIYYTDNLHPNADGYRAIAAYILSQYFPDDYTFEKIMLEYDVDGKKLTLPQGAALITDEVAMSGTYNTDAIRINFDVSGKTAAGFKVNGKIDQAIKYPFVGCKNHIEMTLENDLIGNGYITFHIDLPSANRLGITGFLTETNKEIIFKANMPYQILPDGETQWQDKISGYGKDAESEAYGAIEFDSAFSGYVKMPISAFYNSPTVETPVNRITIRFANFGPSYGEVKVGAFLAISDPPYIVKNVWTKDQLPEMTPFTQVIKFDGYETMRDVIQSPLPTLSDHKAMWISASPTVDKGAMGIGSSYYWASMHYDRMPIGNFTDLMIYVEVPNTQDNYLSLCMFVDGQKDIQHGGTANDTNALFELKVWANQEYQLLALGETEWQHYVAYKFKNNYGGIELPAGFKGFIKIPYESLLPAGYITSETVMCEMVYRFAYIGTGEDSVLVGPVFGVTKDNDTGSYDLVLSALPEKTTIKSLYAPDDSDLFTDRIMLYWEEYPDADHYLIEAYSVTKTDTGYEYRLVNSKTAFSNSGTIGGLEPNTEYAILIKARNHLNEVIAVYDYTLITTASEDPFAAISWLDEVPAYDTVDYGQDSMAEAEPTAGWLMILIAAGGTVVLAAVAVLMIILIKRRSKKNEIN